MELLVFYALIIKVLLILTADCATHITTKELNSLVGKDETNAKTSLKHNVFEPLVERLEEKIKISGHEKDLNENKHHKISGSDTSHLEKEMRLNESLKLESKNAPILKNIEPSVDKLEDAMMPNKHPKFRHYMKKRLNAKIDNLNKAEPALRHLEEVIQVKKKENTIKNAEKRAILPGYEGFHGVLVHGDEAFYHHGDQNKHHDDAIKSKPADLEDFRTWLDQEKKESKLLRFRKLHQEFVKLSENLNYKKIVHYDDDDQVLSSNDYLRKHDLESLNENYLLKIEEKLLLTIKKLEEEEEKAKQKSMIKQDL